MKTLQSVRAIKGDAPMHSGAWGRAAPAGRIERWIGLAALGAVLLLPACSILPKAEPLDAGMRGLAEIGPAVAELRSTLGSVRAITRQLEDRPADYLLGLEPTKEFTP